ncbi:hypothetical protein ESCO_004377 [Escovopsis weberi]|uniref:Glutathione S-transferase C-terminal domain-containing protein n=1 Tax=Escovopsis weberi TaxID=150374 RepID=A0A0M8N0R2_ESCWE|nr:hypothetical protein ESCO_004377 [Escovopsis weberi]
MNAAYELFHQQDFFSFGELIRIMFQEACVPYLNYAKLNKRYIDNMYKNRAGDEFNPPIYTHPVLRHGRVVICDVPNIMLYLAPRLGLGTDPMLTPGLNHRNCPAALYHMNQLTSILLKDFVGELEFLMRPIFHLRHPERDIEYLKCRFQRYVDLRLPTIMEFLQNMLQGPNSSGGPWLFGHRFTYVDIVLFYKKEPKTKSHTNRDVEKTPSEDDKAKSAIKAGTTEKLKVAEDNKPKPKSILKPKPKPKPQELRAHNEKSATSVSVESKPADHKKNAEKKAPAEDEGLFSGLLKIIPPRRNKGAETRAKNKTD